MMLKRTFVLVAIATVMAATAKPQEEAFLLKWNVKEGDSFTQKVTAKIDFEGTEVDFTATLVTTCKSVKNSVVTLLAQSKDRVANIGGQQTMEQPDSESTIVLSPLGRIIDMQRENISDDPNGGRLGNAFNIFYPEKPVKMGEAYEVEVPENKKLGVPAMTCKYVVSERKTVKGRDVLIIKVDQREVDPTPISINGYFGVEVKTGMPLLAEFSLKNLPQQGVLLNGTWRAEFLK